MKFINKDKKALTLIEVMVFFVVSSILLMLTLPAMTQKKSNRVCIPGGSVIFDGSKNVIGDTSGVLRISCSESEGVCQYRWKAPVNEVYITSVGGGGGGSGVVLINTNLGNNCSDMNLKLGEKVNPFYTNENDEFVCAIETNKTSGGLIAEPYLHPLCGFDFSEFPSVKYHKPTDGGTHYPFGLDPTKYSTLEAQGIILTALEEILPKEYFFEGNPTKTAIKREDIINAMVASYDGVKTECERNPGGTLYVGRFCNLNNDGTEKESGGPLGTPHWAVCNLVEKKLGFDVRTPNSEIINGAGGMGGYYTFGANFDPDFVRNKSTSLALISKTTIGGADKINLAAYQEYMANQAQPISLKKGAIYKIIVGKGGKGGRGMDGLKVGQAQSVVVPNYPDPPLVSDLVKQTVAGMGGGASCVISDKAPDTCRTCRVDSQCSAFVYAVANGGYGAPGTIRDDYQIKDTIYEDIYKFEGAPFTGEKRDIKTFYTAPFSGIPDFGVRANLKIYRAYGDNYHDIYSERSDNKLWSKSGNYTDSGVVNPDAVMEQTGISSAPEPKYGYELDFRRLITGFNSRMFAPQTTGLPGSALAPGKGGPSLFGMDRPGAGGNGNYMIKTKSGKYLEADRADSKDHESRGKNGLVEIRWFTTCE